MIKLESVRDQAWGVFRHVAFSLFASGALTACHDKPVAPGPPAVQEVAVVRVESRDVPAVAEYVGQTESSRQVEIRARVSGFLDKRVYVEGGMVEAGAVLFQMDRKPFETQLAAAEAELSQHRARLDTSRANLKRIRPLAQQDAVSQKDLDDATGQEQANAANVEASLARRENARLDLSYTTITSPVTGLASFAKLQEGSYVSPGNNLLTYVAAVDPIWVDFSVSENQMLAARRQAAEGRLRLPAGERYEVEVVLADGSVYPRRGRITFADAAFSKETGTFLVRATLPNPGGVLRPGQFVRVRLHGATRPNAILVPQRAVLQGARGHFVWVVDKEGKARIRDVEVGPWQGDDWVVLSGLAVGDAVAVDGLLRLGPGAPVKTVPAGQPAAKAPLPGKG